MNTNTKDFKSKLITNQQQMQRSFIGQDQKVKRESENTWKLCYDKTSTRNRQW